jgi:hypothetical protein
LDRYEADIGVRDDVMKVAVEDLAVKLGWEGQHHEEVADDTEASKRDSVAKNSGICVLLLVCCEYKLFNVMYINYLILEKKYTYISITQLSICSLKSLQKNRHFVTFFGCRLQHVTLIYDLVSFI